MALRTGVALVGEDPEDCWLAYLGMAGTLPLGDYLLAVLGSLPLPAVEHDKAARALNESLAGQGLGRPVAYARELSAIRRT